jgi:hypothetical protein
MQGDPSGTSERIADAVLYGHVCYVNIKKKLNRRWIQSRRISKTIKNKTLKINNDLYSLSTCSKSGSIVDVGGLPERTVRSADVMMITTQHDIVRHFPFCHRMKIKKSTSI